jgi:SWI/SNF-related matrix-associated actin-dependent regulator of chromatin subfamily A member 5
MFNSKRGEQWIYLLSTRAGALGITLTGADTVIMYDCDWNPTWDKQAHDRVHRIGQDKSVSIYQLLCKDTVEQRIFQRAAQKLSLNELVLRDDTETKSDKSEDVLSSSEVKKMLRCGVVNIIEGESVPMTEAMADQLIGDAHMRGDGAGFGDGELAGADEGGSGSVDNGESPNVFNQKILEIRQFGGEHFSSAKDALRDIATKWSAELADSRERSSRVCILSEPGWRFEKREKSQQHAQHANAEKKKLKSKVVFDDACLYCGTAGDLVETLLCKCSSSLCHRAFHETCLDAYLLREKLEMPVGGLGGRSCSQHRCNVCLGSAGERGGLIFRCWTCPLAFCSDCLPDEVLTPQPRLPASSPAPAAI